MTVPFTSLYIDGRYVSASNNETYEVRNPYTDFVVGTAAAATSKDCTTAIEAAAKAFKFWEYGNLTERRDIFLKAAELVAGEKYRTKIIETIQEETSADSVLAQSLNWRGMSNYIRTQASMIDQLRGEVYPSGIVPGAQVLAQPRAMGVWFVSPFSIVLRLLSSLSCCYACLALLLLHGMRHSSSVSEL